MKKHAITLEEKRRIQLKMLKEVDAFCRKNDLRYSLAYGTLIGAIRHKGFIPWDDDMDIMMPLPDLEKFKHSFHSEKIFFLDIDTYKNYEFCFPRICYTPTYRKISQFNEAYGINIDIYPVVGLDEKEDETVFLQKGLKKQRVADFFCKWHAREMRYTPFSYMPGFRSVIKSTHNYVRRFPYENSNVYFSVGGYFKKHNIFTFDLFKTMIDVPFEKETFSAIEKYDEYLSQIYGNYMQLPPEDKRHPYHGGDYYWK